MKSRMFLAATAVVGALALSACGGGSDNSANTAAPTTTAPAPAPTTAAAPKEFGPGCASVPTDASNPGSFQAMAKVPVATAASGNPVLKTLVAAVTKANLGDSLNSAAGVTVFAPADSAFGKIPPATLNTILANDAQLKSILTYHVVPQRLAPDQLAGTHKTLQGGSVTVTGGGTSFTVDGMSNVVCGNVQTANATVYIIDTVLTPKA